MTPPPLLLGSSSPRRKEILGYFNLRFEQASPPFDEKKVAYRGEPAAYAAEIACGKALALKDQFPEKALLTADTVVYGNKKVYGKPANEEEAASFLLELADSWHSVFTSVALLYQGALRHQTEETRVKFRPLTEAMTRRYLQKVHWQDKAGGYAVQTTGGLLVERIEGCYYNVMGLPMGAVRQLLQQIGIDLWDFLK